MKDMAVVLVNLIGRVKRRRARGNPPILSTLSSYHYYYDPRDLLGAFCPFISTSSTSTDSRTALFCRILAFLLYDSSSSSLASVQARVERQDILIYTVAVYPL
jgi:hypothetical protein